MISRSRMFPVLVASGVAAASLLTSAPAGAVKVSAGVRVINCAVTVDNPHYSKGAQGVIAKVRYTCTGNTTGSLRIDGYLTRYPSGQMGPYAPVRQNVGTVRSVGPGASGTVYIPADGTRGAACDMSDFYHAWSRATLTAEGQVKSGAPKSGVVHPTKCS